MVVGLGLVDQSHMGLNFHPYIPSTSLKHPTIVYNILFTVSEFGLLLVFCHYATLIYLLKEPMIPVTKEKETG